MDHVDCVVVGAGIIGLAIARALSQQGRDVVVLEAVGEIGSVTSARNSEVIHAGIYYPADSLKAKLCVEGRKKLYAYCDAHHIPFRRCGKLIVATNPTQNSDIEKIMAKALANGVDDLYPISAEQAMLQEDGLFCTAALVSPSTGIVDTHSLMHAYYSDARDCGAMLALNCPVLSVGVGDNGFCLSVGGAHPTKLTCNTLINAAGHGAQELAKVIDGLDGVFVPPHYMAKGNYFSLSGKTPFSKLIYPVPEPGGLGIHLTLDLGGNARFGPDVEWVDTMDYHVDAARSAHFYPAIRAYWPGLPEGALVPGYSGIRPKLKPQGGGDSDFVISGPSDHGTPNIVNLFGIESPGITASLAIADAVLEKLGAA